VLSLYMSGSAMFEKLPATPRMPRKLRGFHRGTPHCLGSSLLHSVDRAVLNTGKKKDFAPGLTYVAISRVRSLPGIMFEEPFDFKRLKSSTSYITIMRATDAAKRLQQEIPVLVEEDEQELPPSTSLLSGR
jgi:hypothetical protein